MVHHRSVCAAAVGAIEDGRDQEGRCSIGLEKTTTSAVGSCNSELAESFTMVYHRSVCVAAIGSIEDSRGHGGRCSIRLDNIRIFFAVEDKTAAMASWP